MQFGNWELRNDAEYWFSKDSQLYPSSNATDEGKLHTEENIRNIYRDLTDKNFVINYSNFAIELAPTNDRLIVLPGEGVIQGYHFIAKNSIEVPFPNTNSVRQFTLGISLTYDAANHVIGDVVNKDLNVGESEVLSGVYIRWFNECEIECNYDNILVLGRAWVKDGVLISDGDKVILDNGETRTILHSFEPDPFKDHKYNSKFVETQIYGHQMIDLDSVFDNLSEIHCNAYTYDSMHFPIELNPENRSKPASHTTDLQDFISHVPDWYTSKYGDYMTGALRFNHSSKDRLSKIQDNDTGTFIKDSINDKYNDGLILSPRTFGTLTKNNEHYENEYDFGGTITTIVPSSYSNLDFNYGYTGIGASLISQKYGETGLRIFNNQDNANEYKSLTRLVHYSENDNLHEINNVDNINNNKNSNKFIIENIDDNNRKSSITFKNGEIFIDSYNSPSSDEFQGQEDTYYRGSYNGSGIQLFASANGQTKPDYNIDFRVDEYKISIANHKGNNHRFGTRGTNHTGSNNDDLYIQMGLGITYDTINYEDDNEIYNLNIKDTSEINGANIGNINYKIDPYFKIGNLRIRSNNVLLGEKMVKQNTIEVLNHNTQLPYIRIKPRTYSEQYLAEQLIQVGTSKYDDYNLNNAQQSTQNRIIIKKEKSNDDSSVTFLEHNTKLNNTRIVFNKLHPSKNVNNPSYNDINGIYSYGNIGCSDKELEDSKTNNIGTNDPYQDNNEWVRFTKFRYDNDKDEINGGSYKVDHENENGRLYGTTYNLEFNTNVANKRANQIIWRYKGSKGIQTEDLENTPPVVLSYIHDNSTKYTNVSDNDGYNDGKGTYEAWVDFNGYTHYNPTDKIRDFLLLENAGLSISGDINNPSWAGDSLNSNNHLGVTITQGRVYNSIYNDFAETYTKSNINEFAKPGEIISLNVNDNKYQICSEEESNLVVGVQSNTYAYLAGGNRINNTQDILKLENEYFTVGISGKVWVRVVDNANIKPGDLITSSYEKGKGKKLELFKPGVVIGKALSKSKYMKEYDSEMIMMQIMLS